MVSLHDKELRLRTLLRSYSKLAIAFSGGVDSTLLLSLAAEELPGSVIAVTSRVPMTPAKEFEEAKLFCEEQEVNQLICTPDVLSLDQVKMNSPKRCYYCKTMLFFSMKEAAAENGYSIIADGTNVDDLADYRPGMKAIKELGVVSPFLEAGFTKKDIRDLSLQRSLSTWNKQSNACLATRIPYGQELSYDLLSRIDQAEELLHILGFMNVRLRVHNDVARIEIGLDQFTKLLDDSVRESIIEQVKDLGFSYITLDLEGFRTGSMNTEVLGALSEK